MPQGKIKFFNESKGFGFITTDQVEEDVYVHRSGITYEAKKDDVVSFEIKTGLKGLNAINVKKLLPKSV